MTALEDGSLDDDEDYLAIVDRAFEIKKLVEITHPQALEHIEKAQQAQIVSHFLESLSTIN